MDVPAVPLTGSELRLPLLHRHLPEEHAVGRVARDKLALLGHLFIDAGHRFVKDGEDPAAPVLAATAIVVATVGRPAVPQSGRALRAAIRAAAAMLERVLPRPRIRVEQVDGRPAREAEQQRTNAADQQEDDDDEAWYEEELEDEPETIPFRTAANAVAVDEPETDVEESDEEQDEEEETRETGTKRGKLFGLVRKKRSAGGSGPFVRRYEPHRS